MNSAGPTVNGFLVLSKPKGMTSMDVVRVVKRLTGIRKRVGHGGTLDPLAEGVLPICFGQATRLMEHLINQPKEYSMTVRLGVETDTYDAEGVVVEERDASGITREDVEAALRPFQGVFQQKPPMHSALKKDGHRLYELARKGVELDLEPREVQVYSLSLESFEDCLVTIRVECGRGMYMRSLAHDLGHQLGCGAHAASLVREKAGTFRLDDALTVEQFTKAAEAGRWRELIRPIDAPVLHMKSVLVSEAAERHLRNGQPVSLGHQGLYAGHLESYRAYAGDGRFLGVVRFDRPQNRWEPFKLFRSDEPSPFAPEHGRV